MTKSPMPAKRDVRVHPGKGTALESDPSPMASKAAPGLVTVMGFDNKDVMFRSDSVGCVQWRDSSGEIVALLIRLRKDIWGFSHRGEDDWPEILEMYGNPDAT